MRKGPPVKITPVPKATDLGILPLISARDNVPAPSPYRMFCVVHQQALGQCHSRVMALIQGEDSLMPHLLIELIETHPNETCPAPCISPPRESPLASPACNPPAGSPSEMAQPDASRIIWVHALLDFLPRLSGGNSGGLTHDPHVRRLLQSYAGSSPPLPPVCISYGLSGPC